MTVSRGYSPPFFPTTPRPFPFSDSSLVGLRPFSLPLFHPARALCVVFVALSCLLRYWMGFYINWQLMTTVSLSLTFRQLYFVHNNICSKPLFTKFNRLSILVANSQLFIVRLKEFAASSNLWNKHCLPLRTVDMRALGVANTYPPLHSPGDCIVVGVFSLFVLCLLLSRKQISSEFATLHLVFADRRATARTTTFVEPCSIQTKKKAKTRSRWSTHFCKEKESLARGHRSGTNSSLWSLRYSDPMKSSSSWKCMSLVCQACTPS